MTDALPLDVPGEPWSPLLVFRHRGEPIPQGSMIPVTPRGGGRAIVVPDNSKVLKPWRRDVAKAAAEAAAYRESLGHHLGMPFDGPLIVDVVFTRGKPLSAPKTRPSYPDTRPDVDKLARAILDSLTTSGVIVDDARICRLVATKAYVGEHLRALDEPGVHVVIARHPLPPDVDIDDRCAIPGRHSQQEALPV